MSAEEDLLDELWRDHTPDLLLYALRRCPSREDACDVVAEVFVVAWRRIGKLPPPAQRRPWLFGVARNVLNNQRRGERRRTRLAARLSCEVDVVVRDHSSYTDADLVMRAALESLTDDARELITLVAIDGLSPAEAAVVLGIAPTTARVRLHRARNDLRKKMEREALAGHVDAHKPSGPTAEYMEVT